MCQNRLLLPELVPAQSPGPPAWRAASNQLPLLAWPLVGEGRQAQHLKPGGPWPRVALLFHCCTWLQPQVLRAISSGTKEGSSQERQPERQPGIVQMRKLGCRHPKAGTGCQEGPQVSAAVSCFRPVGSPALPLWPSRLRVTAAGTYASESPTPRTF